MSKRLQNPIFSEAQMYAEDIPQLDFVLISGDAYIDHPSFGVAIIARVLLSAGFSVGVIAQPDWHSADAFRALRKPKLAFLISSGNMDSMVNHYTVAKKLRETDAYTPGGKVGKRPDRACIVYGNRCREAYAGVPVILGGVEASLRRFAHYDYWEDRVRHSILYDATADFLVYGMGERTIVELAKALKSGRPVREITDIPGTCVRVASAAEAPKAVLLPSYTQVAGDKSVYAEAFLLEMREHDPVRGKALLQPHEKGCLLCNPPAMPLSTAELDAVYALPFTREPMPEGQAHIPAIDEVLFSVTSVRGCFGNCNFCSLAFHQGRIVQSRSHASIIDEVRALAARKDFKGYIHDVGGPTANFRRPACGKQMRSGVCADKQCLGSSPCRNLTVDESDYTQLLRKLREIPGVKKVFVRSGIRFDYLMLDKSDDFIYELVQHHVSGQLKVAPEHVSDRVLAYMNKPPHAVYERFVQKYNAVNARLHMRQYIVPYLMSSHPGCTLEDAIELAQYLKKTGHRPEQVQDFYPTPGTVSTTMYYTGLDPRTMEPVTVPRSHEEKAMQRALMQCHVYKNHPLIRKALRLCDRDDLIGSGRNCLLPEEPAGNRARKDAAGGGSGRFTGKKPEKTPKYRKNAVDKRHRSS